MPSTPCAAHSTSQVQSITKDMTSILVTGASRGIGLELVRTLASHPSHPDVIIATCREPAKAQELVSLSQSYPFVKILKLDVQKFDTFPDVVSQVSALVGENGLNILLNNAGMAKLVLNLEELTYDNYNDIIKTNLFGPVFLTKALLPLLRKAASVKPSGARGFKEVAVLNMSSSLGSVSTKQEYTVWGYNESKAALNQATRSMSTNFKKDGIIAVTLHPGWVKTDMGGPQAPLTVQESVSGLMKIITNLSQEHDDKYLKYDGTEIPW